MCHVWFKELEIAQALIVHIIVYHDITNHHVIRICQSHYEGSFDDF